MRSYRTVVAAMLIVVVAASPAYACKKDRHAGGHHKEIRQASWDQLLLRGLAAAPARPKRSASAPGTRDLTAYRGLGSWVDIFNTKPWRSPGRAVRRMHAAGAESIFLQTSTYGQRGGLYDRKAIDAYLHHAHRRGMKVVAWYVPAFDQQRVDFRRIRQAIHYRSASGERFDSFGLDIEATNVSDVAVRNKRLLWLSKKMRDLAGPNYPLGAITPDPVEARYWPNFPYKQLAKFYDVFVPMGYFTFRASGYRDVHDYTVKGIRTIRRETGKGDVPIHFIGGIADEARPHELKGFVKAARDHGIAGASLYDYPITDRKSWYEMRALSKDVAARRRAAAEAREQAEAERKRKLREKRRPRDDKKAEKKKSRRSEDTKNAKKAKNGKDDKKSADDRRRDSSKKRTDKAGKKSAKKGSAGSKGRRSPSSSPSRRGKPSSPEGARERPRPHAPDHQLQIF